MSIARFAGACLLSVVCFEAVAAERSPPNIVMIVLDDQNTFALRQDLAPQPVAPNLERLAKRGLTFAHAQCAAPVCNPSRAALFSGLRPSTSGVYDNGQGRLVKGSRLESAASLPAYFRERGYTTAGGGKLFAASLGSLAGDDAWDEPASATIRIKKHGPRPPKEKLPLNGIGKHDWGAFPELREDMEDWQHAGWAADFIGRQHEKPFFLACGIVKPHTPWYVPQEYFDLFPPDRITIADLREDETAGLPKIAREKWHREDDQLVRRRKELIAAYLAASRFADDCVGRILDALDRSPYRANTVVVVCSDHGYQFGEKNNWSKGKLWEGSTEVPLVIAGPRIARGEVCSHAVSLLDLYPTLVELAGLPANAQVDGSSLVPLLGAPSADWDHAAITTAGFENHAVRTDRWRYIRYADGSEELYDHNADAAEHINLAGEPASATVLQRRRKLLPQHDEPRVKSLGDADDD